MQGAALACLGALGALLLVSIFLLGGALMAKIKDGAKTRAPNCNKSNESSDQASSVKLELGRACGLA